MPWFDIRPTSAQTDYWRVTPNEVTQHISDWPATNSKRVNALYRLRYMRNDAIFPSASRFYLEFDTGGPKSGGLPLLHQNWGWMDVEPDGEDHLVGTAGLDLLGFNASIDITAMESLPVAATPGILDKYRITEPLGGWFEITYEHPRDSVSSWWVPRMSEPALGTGTTVTTDELNWPYDTLAAAQRRNTVSECYSFPFPPGGGFARFNGSNAWIELTNLTPNVAGTWQWQADIFIRSRNGAWIMAHQTSGSSRTGYNITNGNWVTANVATTPIAPLNTWFQLRMEREWSVPTGNHMKVFFDGVQVGSTLRPNFQTQFNTLGGNRPGTPPFQFGDFDMKNLLFRIGGPSSPSTILDMPLVDNTCDLGPLENHGIPHNMLLPGCPP